MPAVSRIRRLRPRCVNVPSTTSRVVPGTGGNDGAFLAEEPVGQAGLAGVRRAQDGDAHRRIIRRRSLGGAAHRRRASASGLSRTLFQQGRDRFPQPLDAPSMGRRDADDAAGTRGRGHSTPAASRSGVSTLFTTRRTFSENGRMMRMNSSSCGVVSSGVQDQEHEVGRARGLQRPAGHHAVQACRVAGVAAGVHQADTRSRQGAFDLDRVPRDARAGHA